MKIPRINLILAATLTALAAPVFAHGPGTTNDFGGKRVLIIGIDGLRTDALQAANMPNIDALAASGVITYKAYAGGDLGTPTQQPPVSGPGWTSITTGVWTNKHKVVDNDFTGYTSTVAANYPHFAKRVKDAYPNSYISSISSWGAIEDDIVAPNAASFNYHVKAAGSTYPERDLDVKNKAVAQLGSVNPDVLFLHFDQVDGAGHSTGFSPSNPTYIAAIEAVDAHIGSVISAVQARPQYAQEKWLVLLTADHGGEGFSHGDQIPSIRNVPFLVSGSIVNAPHVSTNVIGHTAVPPTALKYLGVPVNPAWGLENPDFGLPPYFLSNVTNATVNLNWVLPSGGLSGLTGYEVRRNGTLIATLGTGVATFADNPGVGSFIYELRFVGTSEVRTTTASILTTINDQLVLHLPLNGSAADASGHNNNATINGTPAYTAGKGSKSGQCLQFTDTTSPHQYLNLGQPDDLKFGATDSFTVSVWVNHSGTFPDNRSIGGSGNDPAILSNKDWDSGSNTGWLIAAGPDGRWQWNVGDGTDRADYDGPSSQISDGQWHHLCAVHDRTTNEARMYYDGALVATRSLSAIGTLDASKPTAVATDGTFGAIWPNWFSGKIDEVKIWRRPLAATEVNTLYHDLDDQLVLHLGFEGNALDSSGRGNNGTVNGSPTYTTGKRGQCLEFTDTASPHQYLSLGKPTDLKFAATDSFTVSVWVNHTGTFPDNSSSGGSESDPAILSNKDWDTGTNTGWFIGAGPDGRWQWNVGDGSERVDYDSPASKLSDGQWHHLCVVHDRAANEARLFYDGTLVSTLGLDVIGSLDASKPTAVATDGTFGSVWPNWFNGKIDEVKIWRRAIGNSEVTAEFQK